MTRFATIMFWETMENVPLLYGFMLALRWQPINFWLALISLVIAVALGVVSIHFTEHLKFSNRPTPRESFVNFATFLAVAVLIFLYFAAGWSTGWTDLAAGLLAGGAVALGESLGWKDKASLKTHLPAMALAGIIFFSATRVISSLDVVTMLVLTGIITLIISAAISWLDYGRVSSL